MNHLLELYANPYTPPGLRVAAGTLLVAAGFAALLAASALTLAALILIGAT